MANYKKMIFLLEKFQFQSENMRKNKQHNSIRLNRNPFKYATPSQKGQAGLHFFCFFFSMWIDFLHLLMYQYLNG